MAVRRQHGGFVAFGLALLPVWLISLGLNWGLVVSLVNSSATLLSKNIAGAWTFVVRVAVFILVPYGLAGEVGYDLNQLFAPDFWGTMHPSPVFWLWILAGPVCLLLVFRFLYARGDYSTFGRSYLSVLRPAAAFAALVWLGTILTPGAEGLLVLIGPLSRTFGDVPVLLAYAVAKSVIVLPYLVVWVCGLAPLVAALIPIRGGVGTRAEQALPADGGYAGE